ncbi:beta-ketoacyl-ACP synthase II [Peredibacter starrii]|uniref:3-oxoacyl-[acyl-carrier-protein] synthase 2 n=1 Tax=Peredibacter starrii TaxID=28202 RepID=A0AAX4HSG0_9BACT|nr:beta-ketoacyl-ACP synthase II [Peredibacter starrii]WPU66125.1 beta-ketoacyl-ACP synthase II [Peredibacter starrii]
MKLNRVAVTGMGAICGLGNSLDEVWANALAGKSGVTTLQNQNTEGWGVTFGGEVKNFKLDPVLMDPKDQERFDLFNQYALHASAEAIKQANLLEAKYNPAKIGIIFGTGLGGFPHIESNHKAFIEKGPRRVSPFFIPSVIPNMPEGLISIHYGFQGVNFAVASACASSAHALELAATEIMLGRQDAMITGGTEAVITGYTIAGFNNMKALSRRNEEPSRASRPYDVDRDGFVMGEGAGIIVLENYDKAVARGARIIAEVVGFGASSDAHHFTAPHPEGLGALICMNQALELSGVPKEEIGYINAHGTSTPLGDVAETGAIKKAFGDHAYKLAVSSTKSMTGHLLGAAGGLESIFCIKALETGILPPTINLDNQDPACDLYYVPNKSEKRDIKYALNNSFGFGGTNSSTIFKKA